MRELSALGVGLVLALFLSAPTIAQEKAKTEGAAEAVKTAESEKKTVTPEKRATKPAEPVEYRMGGIIKAIDAAAKKITLTQHQVKRERTVTLTLGKGVWDKLADLKVGKALNVWVRGKTITRLNEVET